MPKLTVELETVTPLFLGGADPRGKPELRPPAFRGALRYWLRAALGGVVGDKVEAVHQAEAAVFGSAAEEAGGASAVMMRITEQSPLSLISYSQLIEFDQNTRHTKRPGIAYLLFAARGTHADPERKGLFGKFKLDLSTRPGFNQSEDVFKRGYTALWLLTHLGGLGSRSRRGAGALQAIKEPQTALPNLPLKIQSHTPRDLVTELKQGLDVIKLLMSAGTTWSSIHHSPAFDIIHPSACKIWVIDKSYNNWNEAMNEIGRIYQGFRSRRPPDYQTVKDSMITRGKPLSQPVHRAAFGLPVPFFYRSLNNAGATLEAESYDRRSSPLWIRIVKLANGKYTIVLLWFQSEFLPADEQLSLRQGRANVLGPVPTNALLETFLTKSDPVNHSSLKDKGLTVLEVNYD